MNTTHEHGTTTGSRLIDTLAAEIQKETSPAEQSEQLDTHEIRVGPFIDGLTLLETEQVVCRVSPELREMFRKIRSAGSIERVPKGDGETACLNWYWLGISASFCEKILETLLKVRAVSPAAR